tara:strand:+ start:4048 stop:4938 length:891 start_codon:yes stop_codon:yes gene_type:complete
MNLFIILYGPAKTGKTLSAIASWPDALVVGPVGGTLSSRFLNHEPKFIPVGEQIAVKQIGEIIQKAQDEYPCIIIDDFSIICSTELMHCQASHRGWDANKEFNRRIRVLRDIIRHAKCHIVLTMHEQAPKEVGQEGEKRRLQGCPMIPGWQLPEQFPTHADIVARVIYDEDAPGSWPYLYQTGPDESYTTGDRLAITPATFPMNIREPLLLAGYDIPRPEPLAFMEDYIPVIVDAISEEMTTKRPSLRKVFTPFAEKLIEEKVDSRHIRWIFNDALHREYLARHNNNLIDNFINTL